MVLQVPFSKAAVPKPMDPRGSAAAAGVDPRPRRASRFPTRAAQARYSNRNLDHRGPRTSEAGHVVDRSQGIAAIQPLARDQHRTDNTGLRPVEVCERQSSKRGPWNTFVEQFDI
jgi:hypothetical protein